MKGWRGILVEAIPELSNLCARLRVNSSVYNCACVSFDHPHRHVDMRFASLMSVVKGSFGDARAEDKYIQRGLDNQNLKGTYTVRVPARTLTSILDECGVERIDFMSLDVEGYEEQVLKGLDLERHRPRHLLIEARHRAEVEAVISPFYELAEELTPNWDLLYRARA